MIQIGNITAARLYSPKVRETILRAKAGDPAATETMAREMAPLIEDGSSIVPVPSHEGHPSSTAVLALRIKFKHRTGEGLDYRPCITGTPRQSQYITKKSGGLLRGGDLGFRLEAPAPQGPTVIIDDVIGTGETVRAALKLLPGARVTVYAIDITTYLRHHEQYLHLQNRTSLRGRKGSPRHQGDRLR